MDHDASEHPTHIDGLELTCDRLAGNWRLYQLRGGHRYSTDDLLTAWTAVAARRSPRSLADIGAGIGSVGLLTLWRSPPDARLTMVEVQETSHRIAHLSVRYNHVGERVRLHHGDLRDYEGGPFDLITGSPPYFPPGKGTQSAHPQKAAARFELHGDVFDYCQTAARCLAEDGAFCFCHVAADPRPERAIAAAGLRLIERRDVEFRPGQAPLIALFTAAFAGEPVVRPTLRIREADGSFTTEYLDVRAEMGAAVGFLERSGYQRFLA